MIVMYCDILVVKDRRRNQNSTKGDFKIKEHDFTKHGEVSKNAFIIISGAVRNQCSK